MTDSLTRRVTSRVEVRVTETADLVLSVAVAGVPDEETIGFTVDGAPVAAHEIEAAASTRLHRLPAVPPGHFVATYEATVETGPQPPEVTSLDEILYTRPSRYCDSDRLAAVAATHFAGLAGRELVEAAVRWVLDNITYAPGSSDVVDGALEAYLSRRGVCRDTAQLVVTFLRARGVPARLVSVYAPGLQPMDFHAVTEVALDGHWHVVDGTGLAPRQGMVRIATGRDAADTAFLTVNAGRADLHALTVTATVDGTLPQDDGVTPTQLR